MSNNRLQIVRGLAKNETGIFATREEAVNYILNMQYTERPSLEGEPIILRYESDDAAKGPNVILAIGSVGDGTINMANRTFFIDTKQTEEEIEALGDEINKAIKSLTIIPLESDTIKIFSEKTEEGTIVSGDTKLKDYIIDDELLVRHNIIQTFEEGLFVFVDMEYDTKESILKFKVKGETKEFQLTKDQHLVGGYYDTDTEQIMFKLADGQEVGVEVHKLIEEWTVLGENSDTPVTLSKEHVLASDINNHPGVYDWQDILSADVRVAEHIANNIIHKTKDGRYLYVKGTADNIKYKDGTVKDALDNMDCKVSTSVGNLIYKRPDGIYATARLDYDSVTNTISFTHSNGEKGTEHTDSFQLNSLKLLDDITYDPVKEAIVIRYTNGTGEYQKVEIPVGDLFEEWTVLSEAHNVELTKTRNEGKGQDILTADAKIYDGDNNILTEKNHALYVNGISDNIKYDVTGDTTVKDVLDELTNASGDLNKKIDDEIKARQDADDEINGRIDDLETDVDTISGAVDTLDEKIDTRIFEVLPKDSTINTDNYIEELDGVKRAKVGVNISTENDGVTDVTFYDGLQGWNGNDKSNIITIKTDGIHADVDLNYDIANNCLYFSKSNSVEGVKKIQLQSNTIASDIKYDPSTEELVFEYTWEDEDKGTSAYTKRVDLSKLIEEWQVADTLSISLTRDRVIDGTDTLTANVNLSTTHGVENGVDRTNIITIEHDGVHADVDLKYDKDTNKLYFSKTGADEKVFELQTNTIVDKIYYDPLTESLVIEYSANGVKQENTVIPLGELIEEWTVHDTSTVKMTRERLEAQYKDNLYADVKVDKTYDDNIIEVVEDNENGNGGLYVSGNKINDKIDANASGIKELQDELDKTNGNLEAEIKRSTEEDDKFDKLIGTAFTIDEHENITAKFEGLKSEAETNATNIDSLSGAIDSVSGAVDDTNAKLDGEITRAITKENELSEIIGTGFTTGEASNITYKFEELEKKVDNEITRAEDKDNELEDKIEDLNKYEVRNFEGDKSVVIENVAATDDDKKHSNIKVNLSTSKGSETDTVTDLNIDRNNIISLLEDGLHADVDLQYNALTNTLYFSKTGSEGFKKIQLASDTIIKGIKYDPTTEELILTYTVNGEDQDVKVNMRGMLDEWRVSSTTTVTLYKEVNHDLADETHNLDILTAEVNISNNETNILEVRDGGLFVSNSAITENAANIASAQTDIEALKTTVSEHGNSITELANNLDAVSGNLNTLSGSVETLAENLNTVSGNTDTNTSDIQEIFNILGPDFSSDERDTVSQALNDLEGKLTDNANTRLTEVKAIDKSVVVNNSENGESKYAEVGVNLVDSASTENIIRLTELGLYANVDLQYDADTNTLTFIKSGYENKSYSLDKFSRIDSITYNKETETLDVIYKKGNDVEDAVKIPLKELIDEWDVANSDGSIKLTKKHCHRSDDQDDCNGPDILTAEVVIDNHHEDNILVNHEGEGLYVSGKQIADNTKRIGDLEAGLEASNGRITDLESGLAEEVSNREKADAELKTAITEETNRAIQAEKELATGVEAAQCTNKELKAVEKAVFGIVVGTECGEGFEYTPWSYGKFVFNATSINDATYKLDEALNNLSAYTESIYNEQKTLSGTTECIQKELDVTQKNILGMSVPTCGMESDGIPYQYVPNEHTNYIFSGTSFNNTDIILDREVKSANDRIDTLSGANDSINTELNNIENAIGLADDGTLSAFNGCVIGDEQTTIVGAINTIDAEVCELKNSVKSIMVGSDTSSTQMEVQADGEYNRLAVNVRLSHGNTSMMKDGEWEEGSGGNTQLLKGSDLVISDLKGSTMEVEPGMTEFTDTNVLRLVDIRYDEMGNAYQPNITANGLYLSNIWGCGLYTKNGEGTYENRYQTDEDPSAGNFDYNNNVR